MGIIKHPAPSKLIIIAFLLIIVVTGCFTESRMPIIEAANALFSLPTAYAGWVHKVKAIFFQQPNPFFPPLTSFVGGGEEEESMGSQGTTEKVKEAAVKSFDKSKTTIEDSARAAARLADEAVDKTVKKLKRTLSTNHQAEEL